jgi:hypothetical protein
LPTPRRRAGVAAPAAGVRARAGVVLGGYCPPWG